ncbi:MAG: hypothetical protein OXJ56_04765 [Rhodospirillaceae bacterium]|nr:hypothetical protein [Rhodospirillaceae bacterium]
MDVVGHPVAQATLVVHRYFQKLGKITGSDQLGVLELPLNALFQFKQKQRANRRAPWIPELPGARVSDERARKPISQCGRFYLL